MKQKQLTPFPYINGPFYVYELCVWEGDKIVPKYVGRGRGYRAKYYFRYLTRDFRRYFSAPTHNPGLTRLISELRARRKEIMPFAYDCGSSLQAAKSLEKHLIRKHGRLDQDKGPLLNRNAGG